MNQYFSLCRLILLGVFSLFWGSACVHSEYDLNKEMDWTMGLGGQNLVLPIGTTVPIRLDKIIDIEDESLLQVDAQGNYRVFKQDRIEVEVPRIDPVTIQVDPHRFEPLVLEFQSGAHGVGLSELEAVFSAEIDESSVEWIETAVPEQVQEIQWMEFSHPISSRLTIQVEGVSETVRTMRFEGLRLIFPDYVCLAESGTNELTIDASFDVATGYNGRFEIERLTFDRNPVQEGGLRLPMPVRLLGKIAVVEDDLSSVSLEGITLHSTLEIETMHVGLIQGKIDPQIQTVRQTLELNDLPDFLRGEETVLDVDPALELQVENSLGMDLNVDLILSPQRNGTVLSEGVNEIDFSIDAASDPGQSVASSFWFSAGLNRVPESFQYVETPRLPQLLRQVPESVDVEVGIAPQTGSVQQVDLSVESYPLSLQYGLSVPLSFGPALHLVYRDTIRGFRKELGESLNRTSALKIRSQVVSTIPLELSCRVIPLDLECRPLEGMEISVPETIPPGSDEVEPVASSFDVLCQESVPGTLGSMDGVILEVTGTGKEGMENIPLNVSQYLQFDLKLQLFGEGLQIDLND